MTDRIRVLTVALSEDVRVDDVQPLVDAIMMLRGVVTVLLGEPVSPNDYATEERMRRQMRERLFAALEPRT